MDYTIVTHVISDLVNKRWEESKLSLLEGQLVHPPTNFALETFLWSTAKGWTGKSALLCAGDKRGLRLTKICDNCILLLFYLTVGGGGGGLLSGKEAYMDPEQQTSVVSVVAS